MLFPILGLVGVAGTVIGAILLVLMILRDKPLRIPGILMLISLLLVGISIFMIVREDKASADKSTGNQSAEDQNAADQSAKIGADDGPTNGEKTYRMGETWTVDGQWELTITGVAETADRNEYSDKKPGAVYIVDYTYKNLGYEDEIMDGLFLSIDGTVVDSAGKMGGSYPGNIEKHAKETPVGATCDAQACIGVENPGDFTLTVSTYDGNDVKQKAVFSVTVG